MYGKFVDILKRIDYIKIFFIIWGGIIAYWSILCPMYPDEICNSYVIESKYDLVYTASRQVHNLNDVIHNCICIYNTWSGRYTSTFLIYLFKILPHYFFVICNSLVAIVIPFLIYQMVELIIGEPRRKLLLEITILLITIVAISSAPFFDQVFIWETGSIVYSHMVFLALIFMDIYIRMYVGELEGKNILSEIIIYSILGFLVGGTIEHLAPSVFVFINILLILKYLQTRDLVKLLPHISGGASLFIGTCMLILCPGNSMRSQSAQIGNLLEKVDLVAILKYVRSAILIILNMNLLYGVSVIIWIGLVGWFLYKRKSTIVLWALVFMGTCIVSIILLFFSPSQVDRIFLVPLIFYIISFCILLGTFINSVDLSIRCSNAIVLIPIVILVFISCKRFLIYTNEYLQYSQEKQRQVEYILSAKKEGANIVYIPSLDEENRKIFSMDVQDDSENWINRLYAHYYGVDVVIKGDYKKYNYNLLKSKPLLDKPEVIYDDVIVKQIYIYESDDLDVLKIIFDKKLPLEYLYKDGKECNYIAVNTAYRKNGKQEIAYRTFSPNYVQNDDGTYSTYTTIDLPDDFTDAELYMYLYNPDTKEPFEKYILTRL